MFPSRSRVVAVVAGLVALTACGPRIDLDKSLAVTEVFSGWYDFGVVDGLNKLVPSITFRLENIGDVPVNEVQLTVSFWQDQADGEWDSKEVRGIGSDAILPGASGAPVLVRSGVGFTLDQPRAEAFSHRMFRDVTVKIFAKRSGNIVPLGEFKVERRILPHSLSSARP